jgi:ATP-binding cassette subfamily B protein
VLKSTGLNNSYTSFFNRESQNQKEYALQLAQLDAMFFPSMFFMIGLSALITIYVGGLSTFNGEVTAGNIVEFIIYTNMLTWPVSAIGWCASMIQQAEASQKRINEFLNTERQYKPGGKHIPNKIEAIEFKNVSFQYPNAQRKILDNISFIIKENQKIAFVGLTGSGKSTIIDLLLKNIVATEGLIYINGISINNIDTTDLRDKFAYAPQNTFLFSDTIEENLRLSKPNATNQELYLACKKAQFDEEIARIPGGYSAVLGERGVSLSGGQKQRLALARAFLKPSKILILDDSLSALDSYTEDKILKQLMSENNQTLLIVTHRLEQIRDFDLIYVILDGKIVSSGSYTSLSNTNFYFQQLLKHNLYNLN